MLVAVHDEPVGAGIHPVTPLPPLQPVSVSSLTGWPPAKVGQPPYLPISLIQNWPLLRLVWKQM